MALISIITTTYKHQSFIAQTIESILAQTYTDRELLIGDDSPDTTTRDIIQGYIKNYPNKIKARHHIPNKGIIENTNFLLSQVDTKAEYITFLEGDDLYTTNNLSLKLKIFEDFPDVAIVYSDINFIDKDNNIILKSFYKQRNIKYYKNRIIPIDGYILATAGPICSRSSGMFKKNILTQYKIHNIIPEKKAYSVSDRDIYFQISTQHKVYYIDQQLTQYRRHSNNLSGGSDGGTSTDLKILIEFYYSQGLINGNLYKKKIVWINIVYTIFALEHGEISKAWSYYKKTLSKDIFSYFFYKIGILVLFLLPIPITKKILKTLIKRG